MWTRAELIAIPITLIVIALITFFLYYKLKNKSSREQNISLAIIAILMATLEIIKQGILIFGGSSYDQSHIPFHFSSYYIIWFAFAAFSWGRVRRFAITLAFISCSVFIIGFMVNPGMILQESANYIFADYFAFHSFVFHMMIFQFWALIITFKMLDIKKIDLIWVLITHLLFLLLSLGMAHLMNINFVNFLNAYGFLMQVQDVIGRSWLTVLQIVTILVGDVIVFFIAKRLHCKKGITKERRH